MRTLVAFVTRNPLATVFAFIALLAVTGFGKARFNLWQLNRVHQEATIERDRLAADAAAERARANGWESQFADREEELVPFLAAKGDSIATLVADLKASRVEVREYARALLVAEGTLTSVGTPDSAAQGGAQDVPCRCPSRWDGELDDGLLSGTWAFLAAMGLLELDYGIELPLEWVTGTTGDGRSMLNIRSPDSRVTPQLEEYVWTPPEPVIETRCSLTRQGVVGGIGYLLGVWTGSRAGGD